MRRKRGVPVHGWLAVDKPAGVTSTRVVSVVRRVFDAQKAGHGGTLDPLATGILPVALGEATKTVPYVMDGAKTYTFAIVFGEERSTDDEEGEVVATSDVRPSDEAILAALPAFIGDISQVPPAFSAVKIDGQRAYDLAREGEEFEIKARSVRIDSFRLIERPSPHRARFEVKSGKGAYMRSLARDLARAVGSVGHIAELRRRACGPFHEGNAISLDKLEALGHSPALIETLLPVATALDDIPALALTETEARRLASGLPVSLATVEARSVAERTMEGGVSRAMCGDRLVAITRIEGGMIRPVRVLNL